MTCIISQNYCSQRVYKAIKKGGSTLRPDETKSNHTVNSEFVKIECLELCQKEPKCVGFNYRDKMNVVNCQLANLTGKTNHTAMKGEGEWILMNDDKATSCAYLYNEGIRQDGIYTINPDGQGSFQVRCDMSIDGGGWTVFQRREDGSQDFYLGWSDYKAGFGNLSGEFWLGLDKIHRLTKSGQNVLRVDLMDFNGAKRYAKYEMFSVADESDKYRLNIASYSGNANDSLAWHNGIQFTTKDSDNDVQLRNSSSIFQGAWWYNKGHTSNLNGLYRGADETHNNGIKWSKWHRYSMKMTEMKIRPSQF
ncbi:fibrinogen C domain-containing protein 1-like [Dendronephthya gigantea]|uniref:fibrinogen C domain-containing protein 1-like n=1 Tax=Dendronephthya gigantea TaxID=151771 RepID=UPI00106B15C4|nr:fibrinogen C domain-containing protein 1-like [Dendronephthya gigantea]